MKSAFILLLSLFLYSLAQADDNVERPPLLLADPIFSIQQVSATGKVGFYCEINLESGVHNGRPFYSRVNSSIFAGGDWLPVIRGYILVDKGFQKWVDELKSIRPTVVEQPTIPGLNHLLKVTDYSNGLSDTFIAIASGRTVTYGNHPKAKAMLEELYEKFCKH